MKFIVFLFSLTLPVFGAISRSPSAINGAACAGRPCTYVISCANNGVGSAAEIQAAYDDARRGDTIKLEPKSATGAQCVWTAPSDKGVYLRRRPGDAGYITITTAADDKLPEPGTRITPAYKPLMPVLQTPPTSYFIMALAGSAGSADHVRLRGLYFRPNPATPSTTSITYGLLTVGATPNTSASVDYSHYETKTTAAADVGATILQVLGTEYLQPGMTVELDGQYYTGKQESAVIESLTPTSITLTAPLARAKAQNTYVRLKTTTPDFQPNDVIIEHCIFDNGANITRTRRMISLNARSTTIRDSFIDGSWDYPPADSQGILGYNGVGPYVIENNYIHGGSENIMFGGATPSFNGEVESAIIKFNYFPHIPERERHGPWNWTRSKPEGRVVMAGRHVHPSDVLVGTGSGGTKGWFMALNTGTVGTTEPDWYSVPAGGTIYDGEPDTGVLWKHVGVNNRPMVKNNFEIKAARNVLAQHNVFHWLYDAIHAGGSYNGQQPTMLNVKANSYANTGSCSLDIYDWPDCYRARTFNISILNNIVRDYAGGVTIQGGQGTRPGAAGNYLLKGNLFTQSEPIKSLLYKQIWLSPSANQSGYASLRLDDIQILNNTFYTPFTHESSTWGIEGAPGVYGGNNRVSGNIFTRGKEGVRSSYGADGSPSTLAVFPGVQGWGRNVILGSPTGPQNYVPGTVLSNCSSSAACTEDWDYDDPQYGKLFRNRAAGLFKIMDTNRWAKRVLDDGSDMGADPDELPQIRNLSVSPTSRTVVFAWSVTNPIAHIPCIVEVNEKPDFAAGYYAGEMAEIETYFRHEIDTAERNIRSDTERMLTVGHAVPLKSEFKYYYRLQCGGDTLRGSFTTMAPSSDRVVRHISRFIEDPATRTLEVEFGTSYNRWEDAIIDIRTVRSDCETNNNCSVAIEVDHGAIVYYRAKELDASGAVLRSDRVAVFAAGAVE